MPTMKEKMVELNKFSKEKLLELLKNAFNKESVYWTSQRRVYPDQDDLVVSSERDEIVAYLLEISERSYMALRIETFALAVTILDRFLASFKVKSKYLECLAVACLFIACKIKEEDKDIPTASDFLSNCECKCTLSDLMRMELMVLTKFDWNVDDITAVDFLYLYYALLVNPSQQQDLNLLPTLEYKIKQCLCVNDLASIYKPHELAFSLLSLQVDSLLANAEGNSACACASAGLYNDQTMNAADWPMISQLATTMDDMKVLAKVPHETFDKCKEQIKVHLASMESAKTLYDRYLDEYYFDLTRDHHRPAKTSTYSIPTSLAIIKEEDEEELLEEMGMSPMKMTDQPMSYADILKNQKRRLSDSSMGACSDCENSFN